jgi:hypothetical protein
MKDDLIARVRAILKQFPPEAQAQWTYESHHTATHAALRDCLEALEATSLRPPQESCPNRAAGLHTWTNKTPSPPLGTCCDCGQWAMGQARVTPGEPPPWQPIAQAIEQLDDIVSAACSRLRDELPADERTLRYRQGMLDIRGFEQRATRTAQEALATLRAALPSPPASAPAPEVPHVYESDEDDPVCMCPACREVIDDVASAPPVPSPPASAPHPRIVDDAEMGAGDRSIRYETIEGPKKPPSAHDRRDTSATCGSDSRRRRSVMAARTTYLKE